MGRDCRCCGEQVGGATYIHAMHIAILTVDGFNELDSLIALGVHYQASNGAQALRHLI